MKTFERLLFSAITAQNEDTARMCCAAGADVRVRNDAGLSPLDVAVMNGNRGIATLLLQHGADPRAVTRDSIAPLGLASARDDVAMLRTLSSYCAAFETPTSNNKGCLQVAIESGANSAVDYLLAHGADPNAVDEAGNSLLQVACALSRHDLVGRLLEHGASPDHQNYFGRTVLEDALASGAYSTTRRIAERLPTASVRDVLLALVTNAMDGDQDVARDGSLRQRLRDTITRHRLRAYLWHRTTAERFAVRPGRRPKAGTATDRLLTAIDVGDIAAAVTALAEGANPNAITTEGCPAIVAAAQIPTKDEAGVCHLVTALADRGAALVARDPGSGETTLHVACRNSHTLTVKFILKTVAGRRMVNASDRLLNRPLHLATMARDYEAVVELFRAGADMNPANREGLAPLHVAATAYDIPTAAALLKHDANPDLRTGLGKTARQCLPPGADPTLFQALLDNEKARRQRPSIFSSHHPLASLATTKLTQHRLR